MIQIVKVADADLQDIEGDQLCCCALRNRSRTFHTVSLPLTAEVIFNDIIQHQRRRVIVICNTVSQAQGIYRDLDTLNENSTLKITLLHSRFLPQHRAKKETELQEKFAQNWNQQDDEINVLIATQVIEAGINITCEVMHTHLCPMNSLLQRAGRCARFRCEQGEVYVYRRFLRTPVSQINRGSQIELESELEETTLEKQRFLPYDDDICELTWQVLEAHTQSEHVNQNVSFRTEEQWINQVHQQEDSLQAERRKNDQAEFTRRFNDAVFQGDRSTADDLIRSVDNRSVFVWEEPIFIEDEPVDPKKLLAFSVPTPTLCKVWREYQNLEDKINWIFKRIETPKDNTVETYILPACTPINSRHDLVNSIQILVNPRYVYYDEKIGLLIEPGEEGNNFSSPDKPEKQVKSEYRYRMDNYVGHLVLMWKCWREPFHTKQLVNGKLSEIKYSSVRDELLQAGGRFIKTKIFPEAREIEAETLFEYLVFFAIFTHDLGKLQRKWQNVMRGWQQIASQNFGGRHPRNYLLAHTDYNPEVQEQKNALKVYENQHKRPNHAVESAFLAQEILMSLSPLLSNYFHADREQVISILHTIIMAAGRHHSAWAKGWEINDIRKLGKIELHPKAGDAIASSWRSLIRFLPKTLPLATEPPKLSKNIYSPTKFPLKFSTNQIEYLQLYSLVVRALRLCDMRSVQLEDPSSIGE